MNCPLLKLMGPTDRLNMIQRQKGKERRGKKDNDRRKDKDGRTKIERQKIKRLDEKTNIKRK